MNAPSCDAAQSPDHLRGFDTRQAKRQAHLDRAIHRWLGLEPGADKSWPELDRLLATALSRWTRPAGDGPLFLSLPLLVAELQALLPLARSLPKQGFAAAFAGALIEEALDEVAREARRSGRADVFLCLKSYCHADPSTAELAQLA